MYQGDVTETDPGRPAIHREWPRKVSLRIRQGIETYRKRRS